MDQSQWQPRKGIPFGDFSKFVLFCSFTLPVRKGYWNPEFDPYSSYFILTPFFGTFIPHLTLSFHLQYANLFQSNRYSLCGPLFSLSHILNFHLYLPAQHASGIKTSLYSPRNKLDLWSLPIKGTDTYLFLRLEAWEGSKVALLSCSCINFLT